ncbi:carboxylate-amine ligase [Umezawaea beigongshangensis]|uniref:carboxylate-amine ligase n=1 Tax=Umezawaea beigongshangensis TaxID=2780383 RepID=UPI0027DD06F3|nr:glutamate--cysteine ligase [Umezawaea beigongshangensis]
MLTVGVEEEFLLVDQEGQLCPVGPAVVDEVDPDDTEGEIQRELARAQVESATGICTTAEEIVEQLREMRERLAQEAASSGARLIPSGTPILSENQPPEITPNLRYRRMAKHFGAIASTGSTCGNHVHVAVPDRETAVRVSNHLRPWLPVLLALTANSPFFDGVDTAYASWRHVLWSRWPSAGPPPLFDSLDHYESSVEALLRSEAMLDRAMVYWDVRLSEAHPTLEFRVCDVAATPEEAALVALFSRGLVTRALHDIDDGVPAPRLPQEVLRGNLWRAARDGFGGSVLHPVNGQLVPVRGIVAELLEHVRPVLEASGDVEFAERTLAGLDRNGGGAQRQQAAYARRGDLADVLALLTAESGSA